MNEHPYEKPGGVALWVRELREQWARADAIRRELQEASRVLPKGKL